MRVPAVGELRRRLVLEVPSEVADGAGGVARTFAPALSLFGRVEPRRRRESLENGRLVGLVTHRVTVRTNASVVRGARFVDGAAAYRVLAVEPGDPVRRFLSCLCEEEQA